MKKLLLVMSFLTCCSNEPILVDEGYGIYYDQLLESICTNDKNICIPVRGSVLFSDENCLNPEYGLDPNYMEYRSRYISDKNRYFELGIEVENTLDAIKFSGENCEKFTYKKGVKAYKEIAKEVSDTLFYKF